MKINLSMSGGGVKGIAHLGGLKALEEAETEVVSIAGSSAGAIIAALYGAGYSIDELKELVYQQDLTYFKDSFSLIRLIKQFGLYKGDNFFNWIKDRLSAKEIFTFRDLPMEVKIIVSNATYRRAKVFSKANSPDFLVAKAVRMSMSIPIFYIPYRYQSNLYIDGGVMNNFPLQVFAKSERPTLGLMLIDERPYQPSKLDNLIKYLTNLIEMIMTVNERRQIELSDSYVVPIPTLGYNVVDFSLSDLDKDKLYNSGYKQVKEHLAYFTDRYLTKGFKNSSYEELKGTTIELEEYSQLMVNYITEELNPKQIDGIVTTGEDDYLFTYLIASSLRKKFSVLQDDTWHYNRIKSDEKLLLVSFRQPDSDEIGKLLTEISNLKADVIAAFFFASQRENNVNLFAKKVPTYIYSQY